MIEIHRKEGWILNPNDKIVNAILKRCSKNEGLCPCVHNSEDYEGKDLHCPCTDYTMKNKCECGLYIKDDEVL
jgi:ferredoxin-thioredoxin reductase catalytic subunit